MIGLQMTSDTSKHVEPQPVKQKKPELSQSLGLRQVLYSLGGLVLILGLIFGMGRLVKNASIKQSEVKPPVYKSILSNNLTSQSRENRIISKKDIPEELNQSTFDDDLTPQEYDAIMSELSFLNYQPDEKELGEDFLMSAFKDSLARADWFEIENNKLSKRRIELKQWAKELSAREIKINQQVESIDRAKSEKLMKLARLYDNMEAAAVVELMNGLDDNTVAAIIPKMKNKNGAKVLSLMSPQRAAVVSEKLLTIASN